MIQQLHQRKTSNRSNLFQICYCNLCQNLLWCSWNKIQTNQLPISQSYWEYDQHPCIFLRDYISQPLHSNIRICRTEVSSESTLSYIWTVKVPLSKLKSLRTPKTNKFQNHQTPHTPNPNSESYHLHEYCFHLESCCLCLKRRSNFHLRRNRLLRMVDRDAHQ